MSNQIKKISVVLCTYNGEKYLKEQLDTIVNQTYPIYELIIQDDRSTDNTISIIKEYSKKYSLISYFINPIRLGAHPNFFNALKKAQGDYIAISDQDDIWDLEKIEKQLNRLEAERKSLCFSLSKTFGVNVPIHIDDRIPNSNIFRLMFYPIICGHAMIFKRTIISYIPEIENSTYDHQLALSACLNGGISVCAEFLTYHRRHINAYSYVKPKNYDKKLFNITNYLFRGILGYFKKCDKIEKHFEGMRMLLDLYKIDKTVKINKDTYAFVSYMAKPSFISLIKSSYLCYKYREQIFYAKEKDCLMLKGRALLFPFLCSDYY